MKTLIHIIAVILFLLFVILTCTPCLSQVQRIPHDSGGNTYSIRTGGISRDQAEAIRREAGRNAIRYVIIDRELCWVLVISAVAYTPSQAGMLMESIGDEPPKARL